MSGDDRPASESTGLTPQMLSELEAAAAAAPLDATLQITLAAAYETAGDRLKAAASRLAALALTERNALALYNIATAYMNQAQLVEAERWYRVALALEPNLAIAHQNLASLLRERGELAAAAEHLHRAYSAQAVYVEPGDAGAPRILLACAGGIGNVPVKYLLPERQYTQIRCFVDYATAQDLATLPVHQIVFNAIGDPDVLSADDGRLAALFDRTTGVVLNAAAHVDRTRRDRLPVLLANIEGATVPAARRIERVIDHDDIGRSATGLHDVDRSKKEDSGTEHSNMAHADADAPAKQGAATLADDIGRHGPAYPIILRPPASHGGDGVLFAHSRAEVDSSALARADTVYATAYHDYRSTDGHYRKYRMIFVDREPYPYHLAISEHWLVHYYTADMVAHAWKLEEERRFLDDPKTALGPRAFDTIRAIARRLDLDYAGIDFSLLPDGTVLVFEANATMLVHPEPANGPLAHKNHAVQAIVDAFTRLIQNRLR